MASLKVVTILGTRPEIIRLSRIIALFDRYFDHTLVHTGQNYDYELNQIFFEDLDIRKPDHFLECAAPSVGQTMANVIAKSDKLFDELQPEALLVLGDTNSSLCAIPAKIRKIPIFHMEAGNRCFDMRVPEEINRKIVDHIADINLPYTDIGRQYLIREGIAPETVIKTGSPLCEVIDFYHSKFVESKILEKLKLRSQRYIVVSCHREENVDYEHNFRALIYSLEKLVEKYDVPIVFSAHPRTEKKMASIGVELNPRVKLIKPLSFSDYITLQVNSLVVLSDSGTITEESSILNFPAVNIRDTHERPEGFEEGVAIFCGTDERSITQSIEIAIKQGRGTNRTIQLVSDYHAPNVSEKVARIIASYVGYVNKFTWKKK